MNLQDVDPSKLREALGHFPSGVTIISGMAAGMPVGFTCQAFYSVSLDPPLVSFSVMKTSASWPKLHAAGKCAVNILCSDQMTLSETFGRSSIDRWANVRWTCSATGNPLIDSAIGWFECTVHAEHEAGDHTIVICRVDRMSDPTPTDEPSPLIYFRGKYRQLLPSVSAI